MVLARASGLVLLLLVACSADQCGGGPESAAKPRAPAPSVTLRFRPPDGARYREHWLVDLAIPGEGIRRDALSFDVTLLSRMDQGSYALRHSVRDHLVRLNGRTLAQPSLRGIALSEQWGSDRSRIAEIGVSAKTPELATALRNLARTASFGMLIEYPDQAVAVGDSWSIEPRTHAIPSGLTATLRPTYTLEAIEERGSEVEALIAADVQVDLIPSSVVEGVTIEGGGTASGTLRVRVRDGLLSEARTVLHFSQEIMVQGTEVLGFREISATAHISTTPSNQPTPALGSEPITLDPPEDDRECADSLSSAAERAYDLESHQRVHLVSALHGEGLPEATGGAPLRTSAMSLVVVPESQQVELDGTLVELNDLAELVRTSAAGRRSLYLYADATLPLERLRGVVGQLPRSSVPRLVIRDSAAITPPPKASRWLEERLREALFAPSRLERQMRLHSLLLAHVTLCEPALDAFQEAIAEGNRSPGDLPSQIVKAFGKCGCTSTNLEGLEATLHAIFGSPDLRSLALPRRAQASLWTKATTVRDFAKLLEPNKQGPG
jgi:hypothetical protein